VTYACKRFKDATPNAFVVNLLCDAPVPTQLDRLGAQYRAGGLPFLRELEQNNGQNKQANLCSGPR
jgi:hypothetical protein